MIALTRAIRVFCDEPLNILRKSKPMRRFACCCLFVWFSLSVAGYSQESLERLKYNNPGLAVDLGVGLWSWPMAIDWDHDGDWDLLVSCPDKPSNGVYLFENPAGKGVKQPIFKPGKRLGPAARNMRLSWDGETPRLLSENVDYPNFLKGDFETTKEIYPERFLTKQYQHFRQNPWQFVDLDADGKTDLLIGHGIWDDFGTFGANAWWEGYDEKGNWTFGHLRGHLFWLRNTGTSESPEYQPPVRFEADGKPLETYGWPSPCPADYDGDGDLDIVCGEFRDSFTYFENIGTKTAPRFAAGLPIFAEGSHEKLLTMDLQMIVPHPVDWDGDGDVDLVVGDEDGRVALVEFTGNMVHGRPVFHDPVYFKQEADTLKCGALATPVGTDWDGDGDVDIVSGNTAGYIEFFENLSGAGVEAPKWAAPRRLTSGEHVIRILAGPNGSIQGPAEAKWGYTTLSVADWNGDQLPDLVVNSIWGRVHWYQNVGTRQSPKLAPAKNLTVTWEGAPQKPVWYWWKPEGNQWVTQWRTTPVVVDFDRDGLPDLVMLDHEGYLSFLKRRENADGKGELSPPRRIFCDVDGKPLQLNPRAGGRSGRRKLTCFDWDCDGKLDFLVNDKNANFLRQLGEQDGVYRFEDLHNVSERNIEGHDTSPTSVDFNNNGIPDLLIGAEDGRLYYMRNPKSKP